MDEWDKKQKYSYSVYDRAKIWESNLFWKVTDILCCRIKRVAKIYDSIIKEYEREIEIFGIYKSKKILHIGCGSYPMTAFTLSKLVKGKIVCIDKSNSAIRRSKRYISNNKLNERVSIKYGDGTNFPLDGFDTIIISSCSIPKFMILEHLFNNAPTNCKMILREKPGPEKLVSKYIDLYKDKVKIIKKINNKSSPTIKWVSYYVLKI